jgi:hypothetical protein
MIAVSRGIAMAVLIVFVALSSCRPATLAHDAQPQDPPSFVRVRVSRGVAKSVTGAQFAVTVTDASGAKTLTLSRPGAIWRTYPTSVRDSLTVHVTVHGENPYVRGDATAVIPLRPDLLLDLVIYAWDPSMDRLIYEVHAPYRLAFPLHASAPVNDSLIIAWENETRSRPNPIQ